MSAKNLDGHGRWRNLTIAFRMSPKENDDLNMRVRLSGLSKQEYITNRCLDRSIVVAGNPRVYKALKNELNAVYQQLERLQSASEASEELLETIRMITTILTGMKEENKNECH